MKHIIFLFFVFGLSSSYAQNESKQSINKDFKTTENKIKYTDTRLFAQCMFDIPNQSVMQELQTEMYDNPNIEMVRLDYHTQRALIITANIEELTKKDFISWKIIKDTYLKPKYVSMCHAGGLFGIIKANGDVYPCEILEDKKIGNIRDYEYDFINLWKNEKNNKIKKFIKDTKCNCSYECALSYNILGNFRYQHSLLKSAFNLD